MSVLFLDIDGVLNSLAWRYSAERPPFREELLGGKGKVPDREYYAYAAGRQLDPAAVERVNSLVVRTGCHVVLSSAWRTGRYGFAHTRRMLRARGARFKLADRTPEISTANRGAEIQAWLKAHSCVKRFAIIDDEDHVAPFVDQLVLTDFEHGLLDEHVERLAVLLGERPA